MEKVGSNQARPIRRKVGAALAVVAIVLAALCPAAFNFTDDGTFGRSLVLGVVPAHMAVTAKERERQPSSNAHPGILTFRSVSIAVVSGHERIPSPDATAASFTERRPDRNRAPPQLLHFA